MAEEHITSIRTPMKGRTLAEVATEAETAARAAFAAIAGGVVSCAGFSQNGDAATGELVSQWRCIVADAPAEDAAPAAPARRRRS